MLYTYIIIYIYIHTRRCIHTHVYVQFAFLHETVERWSVWPEGLLFWKVLENSLLLWRVYIYVYKCMCIYIYIYIYVNIYKWHVRLGSQPMANQQHLYTYIYIYIHVCYIAYRQGVREDRTEDAHAMKQAPGT